MAGSIPFIFYTLLTEFGSEQETASIAWWFRQVSGYCSCTGSSRDLRPRALEQPAKRFVKHVLTALVSSSEIFAALRHFASLGKDPGTRDSRNDRPFPALSALSFAHNCAWHKVCNPSLPKVLCIEKYAAVMPYHFFRPTANGTSTPTFRSTSVPNDTSFGLVNQSDFLVFDRERGLDLLGPSPSYEFVFDVSMAVHETSVYVVAQNKLYLSQVLSPKPTASIGVQQLPQLAPPPSFPPQLVINLNQSPPTLSGIPLKHTRLRTQRRHIP